MPDESYYVDEDTTDAFLDGPEQKYEDGRTMAELASWAATPGNVKDTIPLPPLTDH
jgi:hypothetical protein